MFPPNLSPLHTKGSKWKVLQFPIRFQARAQYFILNLVKQNKVKKNQQPEDIKTQHDPVLFQLMKNINYNSLRYTDWYLLKHYSGKEKRKGNHMKPCVDGIDSNNLKCSSNWVGKWTALQILVNANFYPYIFMLAAGTGIIQI